MLGYGIMEHVPHNGMRHGMSNGSLPRTRKGRSGSRHESGGEIKAGWKSPLWGRYFPYGLSKPMMTGFRVGEE